jgi:hypothetical protein
LLSRVEASAVRRCEDSCRLVAVGLLLIAFPRRYLPEGSMDQLYPAELPKSAPALPNTTNTTDG